MIDARHGPAASAHNFHRGGSLAHYDVETRQSIDVLVDEIDAVAVTEVWDAALSTTWQGPPVWLHGDVAPTNLLVKGGRLRYGAPCSNRVMIAHQKGRPRTANAA
jgi:aminoglycoside phosphotransferase (APT) family kinase protein